MIKLTFLTLVYSSSEYYKSFEIIKLTRSFTIEESHRRLFIMPTGKKVAHKHRNNKMKIEVLFFIDIKLRWFKQHLKRLKIKNTDIVKMSLIIKKAKIL